MHPLWQRKSSLPKTINQSIHHWGIQQGHVASPTQQWKCLEGDKLKKQREHDGEHSKQYLEVVETFSLVSVVLGTN